MVGCGGWNHRVLVVVALMRMSAVTGLVSQYPFPESCSSKSRNANNPCLSMVTYVADGVSVGDIAKLFTVDATALVGANDINPATAGAEDFVFPNGTIVRIPVPCSCVSGYRQVNTTSYTIQSGDTLSNIATITYQSLVTYEEIATANNITDPDRIFAGQLLVIPFPCTCHNNSYNSTSTIFATYVIQSGDTLEAVGDYFGSSAKSLAALNGVVNDSLIYIGQRWQVPLRACRSYFLPSAEDYELLVASGSYQITADSCVQCNCYGSMLDLQCVPATTAHSNSCSSLACKGGQKIGNFTTKVKSGKCTVNYCEYAGYNGTAIFTSANQTTTEQCPVKVVPEYETYTLSPQASPGRAPPLPQPQTPPSLSPQSTQPGAGAGAGAATSLQYHNNLLLALCSTVILCVFHCNSIV